MFWIEDARRAPDTRRVDVVDGIRVLAIGIVAWFHIWQQSWLFPTFTVFGQWINLDPLVRSGYMWVDLMILVSGFCLYLPWARLEADSPLPDPMGFYRRRLARILPSYLFTLAVMLCVALARGSYATPEDGALDVLTHLTFTEIYFYKTYYATNLNASLWTLAVLMQFYLLFPLLARGMRRWPLVIFALMMATGLGVRAVLEAAFEDPSLYFNHLGAYMDTFALGMGAAWLHVRLCRLPHGILQRLLCSLLAVLAFWQLLLVAARQSASPDVTAIRIGQMHNRLSMGVFGALLLLGSAHGGWFLRHLLANPLTRFLSGISMQFYIWHQVLAVWIRELRIIPSEYENPNYSGDLRWQIAYTAACVTAGIAVACLVTFLIERPAARALLRTGSREKASAKPETAEPACRPLQDEHSREQSGGDAQ